MLIFPPFPLQAATGGAESAVITIGIPVIAVAVLLQGLPTLLTFLGVRSKINGNGRAGDCTSERLAPMLNRLVEWQDKNGNAAVDAIRRQSELLIVQTEILRNLARTQERIDARTERIEINQAQRRRGDTE